MTNKHEMLAFARNKAFDIFREQGLADEATHYKSLNWLEKVIKTIDSVRDTDAAGQARSYFSPGDSCANEIISRIQNAKKTIQEYDEKYINFQKIKEQNESPNAMFSFEDALTSYS